MEYGINRQVMKKDVLTKLVDSFILESLSKSEYDSIELNSRNLLTSNRLDLAFKLFYLEFKSKNRKLAEEVYKSGIDAQTYGEYVEFGNETNKNSFEDYLESFDETERSIEENGFDDLKSLIPLCRNYRIINGAHRVSSAIFHNKKVSCIRTEQDSMHADYKYFFKRNVNPKYLDIAVNTFIEHANNAYIAFLWPSGKGHKEEVGSFFSNVIYKKQLHLNHTGALNLLVELYKHMDWVGTESSGFSGAQQKVSECFPNIRPFTVVVFQSDSLESVRKIKERVRKVYGIGFSSIHITDTKEEAKTVSKLIFNDNGLHFLNFSKPYKYKGLHKNLDDFHSFLKMNNISSNDVVIDGSLLLALYGLRKNLDIDCLYADKVTFNGPNSKYESHDSELIYHETDKDNLIYNPQFYFEYFGLKFIAFDQLFLMKGNRNEVKDINDRELMKSLIEKRWIRVFLFTQKQKIYYQKVKIERNLLSKGRLFFKKIGLHHYVKLIYRSIFRKE